MNTKNISNLILGLSLISTPLSSYSSGIKENVDSVLSNTDLSEVDRSLNISKRLVTDLELKFFYEYFNIEYDFEFDMKVREIQKRFGLTEDGVLGSKTLEHVYQYYYMTGDKEITNENIKKRIDIYYDMLGYDNVKGAIYSNFNVFNKMTFYGNNTTSNIEGTYINKELSQKLTYDISDKQNLIKISKIDGRNVLLMYNNGKLNLASYVSIGRSTHKTPTIKTKGNRQPDKFHVSNLYPEVNPYVKGMEGGAIMPYAVHVYNGIRIHASDGVINGKPQSHGCIRVPVFYMEKIFSTVNTVGIKNIEIDTTDLY